MGERGGVHRYWDARFLVVRPNVQSIGEKVNDDDKKQRSIFEDRHTGIVLKKKRKKLGKTVATVGGDKERKEPTCRNCGAVGHYARGCKVGK